MEIQMRIQGTTTLNIESDVSVENFKRLIASCPDEIDADLIVDKDGTIMYVDRIDDDCVMKFGSYHRGLGYKGPEGANNPAVVTLLMAGIEQDRGRFLHWRNN